ncbi:MAG: sarcosine oxidase subunit gamma SoxG [Deltaproteobacteria bacterium]|jgi:hypothetical protein|nr:sarcosine oxidase subunit gamma SoxG [Deltaproteobacteria bacterium]
MTEILRQSPVSFSARPLKTENRNLWPVVLEYENEKTGQYLVDLSHVCRWDVQDAKLSKLKPADVSIPTKPGHSVLTDDVLINRMNGIQASVWQFAKETPELPKEPMYTDTSEATVAFAIIGDKVFSIAEKLSSLDFLDINKKAPFLLQGPFAHVPFQIVVLSKDEGLEGILLTCSRGYAHVITEVILSAGEEFDLSPAGEVKFTEWMMRLNK